VGDLLFASTTTALSKLADVATGNALISGGVGVAPSYGKIGLTTHVSGTLPVANGGTGTTSLTANNVLLGNGTSALQVVAPGTSGNVLTSNGTTWTSAAAGVSLLGQTDSAAPFETSLGYLAGSSNTGSNNVFVGYLAGSGNTSGAENSVLGVDALGSNTTGSGNVAIGRLAATIATGSNNTVIGGSAASSLTTGTNNTVIGNNAAPSSNTVSNEITLGNGSITTFRIPGLSVTWGANTVPYRNIPPVGTKTSSYTLAVADVGKYVQVGASGSIVIPDATFAEGDVVSVFNNTSGSITITCSITTAYISGIDSDKATVSLATRGVATILFISGTVCVISGAVS
jgi:hypothetical protein